MTARQVQDGLRERLEAQRRQKQDLCGQALSRREAEVLRRCTTGQEAADIAADLLVTEAAVKAHLRSVLAKVRPGTGRARPEDVGLDR